MARLLHWHWPTGWGRGWPCADTWKLSLCRQRGTDDPIINKPTWKLAFLRWTILEGGDHLSLCICILILICICISISSCICICICISICICIRGDHLSIWKCRRRSFWQCLRFRESFCLGPADAWSCWCWCLDLLMLMLWKWETSLPCAEAVELYLWWNWKWDKSK